MRLRNRTELTVVRCLTLKIRLKTVMDLHSQGSRACGTVSSFELENPAVGLPVHAMAVEGAQTVINIDCFDEAKGFVVELEKDVGDGDIFVAAVEVMRASPDHLTVVLAQHRGHPRDPSDIHLGRSDQSLEPVGTETVAPAKSNRSPLERVVRVLQSSS